MRREPTRAKIALASLLAVSIAGSEPWGSRPRPIFDRKPKKKSKIRLHSDKKRKKSRYSRRQNRK